MNGMEIELRERSVCCKARDGGVKRRVTETGEVIPGRSLGAWDHLAWHHWGACCPSLGWVLPLHSEMIKKTQMQGLNMKFCVMYISFSVHWLSNYHRGQCLHLQSQTPAPPQSHPNFKWLIQKSVFYYNF